MIPYQETRKSRKETNLMRLLARCEKMAKENSPDEWRLEKFIKSLEEMLVDLRDQVTKPSEDLLLTYTQRIDYLKRFVTIKEMDNPLEKMVAAQMVPKVKFEETTNLQQKTKERIHMDLRQELFAKQNENLRKRKSLSVDTSEPSDVEEDMDTLLKYHHSVQEKIADNMLVLAQSIKEQSLLANSIIRTDTRNVEKSTRLADSNYSQLKQESDKLQEENKRAWRCWLWVLLVIVLVIFIQMVLFMRVMKK